MIPGLGRSPGEGKGYPLQYSGLENSMDHIVHGVAESQTQLSDFHFALLGGSVGKETACNAGDPGLILGSGRSPGERNGNPLQYSCLENPMDRGSWQATVHGVTTVGHDSVTKPPPPPLKTLINLAASQGST